MVVARAADIGVKDRSRVRGALWRQLPIELVVEDGFDRAVGLRADLYGALRRGFDAFGPIGADEANNAQTGAIALFGMRPRLQNLLAERRRRRADLASQ
ncbi:MAG: hypothetical protein FD139_3793 [Methylocystaceae bacterium]|nr:MAG: hypothetical protein FD172_3526 [Methylocystaceae bacterium]TXT42237.1 MAG: hypothetical protein FD139_3793 [Methylocystaceae bacterium]